MFEKEYLDLLNKKNSILKELFDYTKSKTFKVSEEEVDRIEYYFKNRSKIFEKLYNVEDKIKVLLNNNYNIKNKDIEDIINENDLLIKEIIILDEEKKVNIEAIFNLLKKEIKSIKSLSKINKTYLGVYENMAEGNFFDSSR